MSTETLALWLQGALVVIIAAVKLLNWRKVDSAECLVFYIVASMLLTGPLILGFHFGGWVGMIFGLLVPLLFFRKLASRF